MMEQLKMDEETRKEASLSSLRWSIIKSNGLKRVITGASLLTYFLIVVYVGVPLLLLNALIIQIKCFDEVIKIAYIRKKLPNISHFRILNWYFLITANYFFSGETYAQHFDVYIMKHYFLQILVKYHRFISFCWYLIGLVWFLGTARNKLVREQFSLLFWAHFLIIIICLQSYMVVQNVFQGLVWLIIPLLLVILNDTFAYVFGKLLGKTPLITLSPKKTVEGFVLGGISTVVLGAVFSHLLCKLTYLVCPLKYVQNENGGIMLSTNCTRSYLFELKEYKTGITGVHFSIYPFVLHSLALAVFASIIAPFGGFCASGFKRAFKIKDFGSVIPGHGGLMDRFDCQFLMATFVNVYISSFIKRPDIEEIYQRISYLSEENQLEFYHILQASLNVSC